MNKYFDTFIEINSVATRLLQYGLKEPLTEQNKADEPVIILMIPGNPGEVEFYKEFMEQIHSEIKLPVIGVSHGGHSVLPNHSSIPPIDENPELYSTNGQIVHKMSFISKFISEKSKLILMGHSIGCYIILELLHSYPHIRAKVLHSISIFPAIESLIDNFEVKKWKFFFDWFKYPMFGLSHFCNLFSEDTKQWAMGLWIGFRHPNCPDCSLKSAANLMSPQCLRAMIFMAYTEFEAVKELNREAIAANEERLTFLYGEADVFCHIVYYRRIRELYPNCDIRLSLKDMDHNFVVDRELTLKVTRIVLSVLKSVPLDSNKRAD